MESAFENAVSSDEGTTDSVVGAAGEVSLWLQAKELDDVMSEVIGNVQPSEQLIQDVDRVLSRHATDFASLFSVKPPSPVDRTELQKCCTEGRPVEGMWGKQLLAYAVVNEVILLSDMFKINEFLALDLLTIAENDLDNYPNWPRGLVAVYMLYESRFWLMRTLYTMIRCSRGLQWDSNFHPQIRRSFRRILDLVFNDKFVDRLITLMEVFSVDKQLEMLESNLALGDFRHRRKVKNLLFQIRDTIAQIIFCYAEQVGLSWTELTSVLNYLQVQVNPVENKKIRKAEATLIAATLYTVEAALSPPQINMAFGRNFREYLKANQNGEFQCMELHDVLKLSFLIAAHKMPSGNERQEVQPESGGHSSSSAGPHGDSATNESVEGDHPMFELLGDESGDVEFTRNFFGFLEKQIFSHPSYYTWDSDICKVFHGFFVDFITSMPLKLKDIKYRSEEATKTILLCYDQGLPLPPQTPTFLEYESFLECVGEFYKHDPFGLGLSIQHIRTSLTNGKY